MDPGRRHFAGLDVENGQLRLAGLELGIQRLVDVPILNSVVNAMSGKVDAGGAGSEINSAWNIKNSAGNGTCASDHCVGRQNHAEYSLFSCMSTRYR